MKPSVMPNKMSGVLFYSDGYISRFLSLKVFYVTFQFFVDGQGKILARDKTICAIIFMKARAWRDYGLEAKISFLPNNSGGYWECQRVRANVVVSLCVCKGLPEYFYMKI